MLAALDAEGAGGRAQCGCFGGDATWQIAVLSCFSRRQRSVGDCGQIRGARACNKCRGSGVAGWVRWKMYETV